jgi:hypothetical protein
MHFLIFFGVGAGLLLSPRENASALIVRSRPVLAAGVIALIVGCAFTAYDYRKAERLFFLVTDAQAFRALGSPELNARLDELNRATWIYRLHTEYSLGARVPTTQGDLKEALANNERLLRKVPIAGTISREVLLLTLAGDLDAARWHLRRLLKFAPATTDQAIAGLRSLIKDLPDKFGPLKPILDEELAVAPERNW